MSFCIPQKYWGFKKHEGGGIASSLMLKYDWIIQCVFVDNFMLLEYQIMIR